MAPSKQEKRNHPQDLGRFFFLLPPVLSTSKACLAGSPSQAALFHKRDAAESHKYVGICHLFLGGGNWADVLVFQQMMEEEEEGRTAAPMSLF